MPRLLGAKEITLKGDEFPLVLLGFDISGETPKPITYPVASKGSKIVIELFNDLVCDGERVKRGVTLKDMANEIVSKKGV